MASTDSALFFGWIEEHCRKILTLILGPKHKKLIASIYDYANGDEENDDIEEIINKFLKGKLVLRVINQVSGKNSETSRYLTLSFGEALTTLIEAPDQYQYDSISLKKIRSYLKKYDELCEQYPGLDKLSEPKMINLVCLSIEY